MTTCLLGALTVVLGLPFVFVPTPVGGVPTMHLPAILEGPLVGAGVGLIFGAFRLWRAQAQVHPIASLMFTGSLVAHLSRLCTGVVSAFRLGNAPWVRPVLALIAAACTGHTVHGAVYHLRASGTSGPGTPGWWLRVTAAGLLAGWGVFRANTGVLGLSVARGYLPAPAAWAVGPAHGAPEIMVAMAISGALHVALPRARLGAGAVEGAC